MSDRFWPDARASIILMPGGEQGRVLLDLASRWTRMELLGPALWVMPEHVDSTVSGPPRIGATVLGLDGALEITRIDVDLFETLARESLRTVRLIKLRSASPSRESDSAQDAIAGHVDEYVRKSMPLMAPGTPVTDQAAELKNLTLICAPTEFQLQQRVDWAASEYGTVVIASPEDRSSPWSGDAFVRDDDRFVGFTLLHLASVAGLWNGVPTGSFELVRREESGQRSVWLTRVFVNAVLAGSLARRTAADVLAEAGESGSLLVDPSVSTPPPGTAFIQDVDITRYLESMIDGAMKLDAGALAFHPPADVGMPELQRFGFFDQAGRFLAFSGGALARMPKWTWRWTTSRGYRKTTRLLHGSDGSGVVGPVSDEVFDARERALIDDALGIVEDERQAQVEAGTPVGLSRLHTTPELWARLRQLVFGSLDGSADLTDLGFAPVEGVVPIFGRVSDVLGTPDTPWVPNRALVPDDYPEKVDWYVLALNDPREQLARALDAANRSAPTRFADTGDSATADAEGEEAADPGGAPVPAGEQAPPHRARTRRRGPVHARPTDDAERFAEGIRQYDEWALSQDRSFVWRLLHRLSTERRAADDLSSHSSAQIGQMGIPPAGELIRLRRQFHRRMIWTWVVLLLAIGGLTVLGVNAEGDSSVPPQQVDDLHAILWRLGAGAVILALVLTVGWLAGYHRGWSRFQRRIDLTRDRLRQLGQNARQARQEALRLRSLHKQAVDWLVLLSRALHRPWIVPDAWRAKDEVTTAQDAMPFALQIAVIEEEDHAAAARLRGVMTDRLMVKGWRHSAFESLVEEVAKDRGMSADTLGLRTLDEDLPHASNHTRAMLLAALDDERVLTRVSAPRVTALVTAAHREATATSRPRVRKVANDPLQRIGSRSVALGESEGAPWDRFLLESLVGRADAVTPLSSTTLTAMDLGDRYHERVQSHVVIPQRLLGDPRLTAGSPVIPVAIPENVDDSVDLAWRIDIAGPVPIRAIQLWNRPDVADRARPPAPSAAESGV